MTSKWIPETDLLALRRLGKTCEELGELVAVLGRSICQGIDGVDPSSDESNIERMTKESADVMAQLLCNFKAFGLNRMLIDQRIADKSEKMAEWEAMFNPVSGKETLSKFDAASDAERLRSVGRGMSYNDLSEATWKHVILEIAMRLETGGYNPAIETTKDKAKHD
ncbi:hypothetical protein [Methylophilus sp. DW102]|uniref:hypothetical protein n=1 Tax=Methylophilus sp. DW102 TaxID=3095607 RepID=UPI00308B556F|nr:hypothetical protein MTDW_26270 [Methylophilus sp. DW102]